MMTSIYTKHRGRNWLVPIHNKTQTVCIIIIMMPSSNGNIFRATAPYVRGILRLAGK